MFGFLKDKLKKAVSSFTKKSEEPEEKEEVAEEKKEPEKEVAPEKEEPVVEEPKEEPKEEVKEEPKEVEPPKEEVKEEPKEEIKEPKEVPAPKEEVKEEPKVEEVKAAPKEEPKEEVKEDKPGFFSRLTQKVTKKNISQEQFEDMFTDLEFALLENSVAMEVIEKIKEDLQVKIIDQPVARGEVATIVSDSLKKSIGELFIKADDLVAKAKTKKPYVICFVGVNGSGKTTNIAKVAKKMLDNGLQPVLAAADTFRAAAIDQLNVHGDKLGVKVISHDYGADAAAVAFDAIQHAKATNKDVVLIDTAGRLHSNQNLMEEMKKIVRVAKPDLKIFVGESITGNDCVEQAKHFNDAIGVDGIILSKADVDEKGGAAISISYVTQKPIFFIGTGQTYDDLQPFNPEDVMEALSI
ncbi:MAG: signal recognition particle-docking protein FtsY [Candidatus Woesearchaeota archaeon]|jgi:fused signal recognition particle receptor|nr:signal recognition particle-docking protein FtsY [Candidatus Woesearchaeota archaeon]MDP7198686.1 signal recognition particle-docking protein FtsY [Candidatus Woesearchaeota archaeon]MDP7467660.1 signal recognition particle-docking protein FtsY [Candidatus Woesearchaeota archaeon]MDP7647229.1 signal recognition particle-docking protein FtsY [Candidatus Woesearchaeota archaeon]